MPSRRRAGVAPGWGCWVARQTNMRVSSMQANAQQHQAARTHSTSRTCSTISVHSASGLSSNTCSYKAQSPARFGSVSQLHSLPPHCCAACRHKLITSPRFSS